MADRFNDALPDTCLAPTFEPGVWQRLIKAVSGDRDLEMLMIDSTYAPTCGWHQKKEGHQAISRSRDGWTSKIHAVVDALGNPVRWLLTGGEVANITQAKPLLEGLKTDAVLGDKGYDANDLITPAVRQQSFRPSAIAWFSATLIGTCIKTVTWSNVFLIGSSNSDASQHAMKNWLVTTCLSLTSFALTSGLLTTPNKKL